jgi:E3 ubiquitin-protein ligase HUWE1
VTEAFLYQFLEGLFQNVAHNKEFVKLGGAEVMFKFYSLRMLPYDFTSSTSSFSLSFLLRILIETNYQTLAPLFGSELSRVLEKASQYARELSAHSWSLKFVDLQG